MKQLFSVIFINYVSVFFVAYDLGLHYRRLVFVFLF